MTFELQDRAALEDAIRRLEGTTFLMRLSNSIGGLTERAMSALPDKAKELVTRAAHSAIERCMDIALRTIDFRPAGGSPLDTAHRAAAAVSGAVGGFFGFYALPVELPASTAIMLRSIADIGRSEGEDLSQPSTRLSCMAVFALGGRAPGDDASETGYYAVRLALAQSMREVASYIAERGIAEEGAPVIVRFIAQIAARFGIVVSEKAAAQAVPVIGAAGGAGINLVFIHHFQEIAHGHFTVRRLERKYGAEPVREEYGRVKAGMGL